MNLAFVIDPIDTLNVKKDSTYAIMQESQKRGYQLTIIEYGNLFWDKNKVMAYAHSVKLVNQKTSWYFLGEVYQTNLDEFDFIFMRKDPPFDMEYIYHTHLLEMAENSNTVIVNKPASIRNFDEKLSIANFPQYTAPTLVTSKQEKLHNFLERHRKIILKPLGEMGGNSIFKIDLQDPNKNVIIENMTRNGVRTIMAQKFIPQIDKGDKRVLLINGEPIPYSLARIPPQGDIRGNLAAGGKGIAMALTSREKEIANTLGPILKKEGLIIVGLDIIGDYLTEINVTSPTCMREITDQTGYNVAGKVCDALDTFSVAKSL